MLILPILLLAALAYGIVMIVQHRHATAAAHGGAIVAPAEHHFWPSSVFGWVSLGAIALSAPLAMIGSLGVPYLGVGLMIVAVLCAVLARFVQHDHTFLTTTVLILGVVMLVLSLLFVLGEVVIGHD